MCWQVFARFRCGHTQLIEEECEHARELDLTFWLKVDCPYYRISHSDAVVECGAGRFYCAETHDGQYLDSVVKQKALSEQRLHQFDTAVNDKLTPWEDSVVQQLRTQHTSLSDASQAYAAHPHIIKIKSLRQDIQQERHNVCIKIHDAESVLYYSDQFFKLNAHHTARGRRPALPGYLRQFGARPFVRPRDLQHNGWRSSPHHGRSQGVKGASRALQDHTRLQGAMKPRPEPKQPEIAVRRSARGKRQVNYAEEELASEENSPATSPVAPASSLKDIILEQRQRDAARLKSLNQARDQNKPGEASVTLERPIARRAPPTYEEMRVSFAKQVSLQPTNLTPPTAPHAIGSPLKRKVSSSPALPSNKKLHLVDGEGASPISASSPPPAALRASNGPPHEWELPRHDLPANPKLESVDEKLDFSDIGWNFFNDEPTT